MEGELLFLEAALFQRFPATSEIAVGWREDALVLGFAPEYGARTSCAERFHAFGRRCSETAPIAEQAFDEQLENAFAKLKALLRKAAERTVEVLWTAIGQLIDLIVTKESETSSPPAGCHAW